MSQKLSSCIILISSVQFSHSVMSDSLQPHESQHARPPYPSPTPRDHPNSCASSQWCHPAISSSVVSFSSCPQSLPASGSFPMNQLFPWGGQSIGVSALASVLPMNTQDWSPLGWTGWISLQSKGLARVFSSTTVQKHQFFGGIVKCLPEGVDLFAFPPATMRMPDSTASPTDIFFFPVSLVGNSISSSWLYFCKDEFEIILNFQNPFICFFVVVELPVHIFFLSLSAICFLMQQF